MSFTVPLPPRTQLYNRSCSNKHTHTMISAVGSTGREGGHEEGDQREEVEERRGGALRGRMRAHGRVRRSCSLRTINADGHGGRRPVRVSARCPKKHTHTHTRVHTQYIQPMHRASKILASRISMTGRSGNSQYNPYVSSLHDCQDFACAD